MFISILGQSRYELSSSKRMRSSSPFLWTMGNHREGRRWFCTYNDHTKWKGIFLLLFWEATDATRVVDEVTRGHWHSDGPRNLTMTCRKLFWGNGSRRRSKWLLFSKIKLQIKSKIGKRNQRIEQCQCEKKAKDSEPSLGAATEIVL